MQIAGSNSVQSSVHSSVNMERRQMLLSTLAAPLFGQTASSAPPERQYYELRWFYLRNGSHAPRMMDLLQHQWAPAAQRTGVQARGFFQASIGDLSPSILMLSAFSSADEAAGSFDRMMGIPNSLPPTRRRILRSRPLSAWKRRCCARFRGCQPCSRHHRLRVAARGFSNCALTNRTRC